MSGKPGRKLTAAQKIVRDAKIVESRAAGLTWAAICEEHGVDRATAMKAYDEYIENRVAILNVADPVKLLTEMLTEVESIAEDMAVVRRTTDGAAKVSAARVHLAALSQKLGMLQAVGVLPRNIDRSGDIQSVMEAMRVVLEVLEARGVPREVLIEVIDAVKPQQGRRKQLVKG